MEHERTTQEILDALAAQEAADVPDPQAVAALLVELRAQGPGEVDEALGATEEVEGLFPGRWQNWPRNLQSRQIDFQRPRDLDDLVDTVARTVAQGKRIKPLGASFSCSEASQPPDAAVAIDTQTRLNQFLALDHLRPDVDPSHLIRVEAGIQLMDLATQLAPIGLALPNLGGFAKQTLAGVMSTGTHGTGLGQSTFADMVASVDVVVVDADGRAALHRFEPEGGITDPASYPEAATRLHQDDDAFYAIVVSCGTLGIVYAYTLEVVDLYWVRETNTRFVYPDELDAVLAAAKAHENLSLILHPYGTLPGGKHLGLLNTFERLDRDQVFAIDAALWDNPPDRPEEQVFLGALAATFGTAALGAIMAKFPKLVLDQMEKFLEGQAGSSFTSVYYKTFPRTTGDRFRATFSETSVPIDDLGDAIDTTLAHAAASVDRYRYLVPFAIRFVGASRHLISMHHGRDSGTLEAFAVKGVPQAEQALRDLEVALPDGRPHWGQLHWFIQPPSHHYPDTWDRWLAQYAQRNALGVFDSPITDLLGISRR